jgi:hypothetical protein
MSSQLNASISSIVLCNISNRSICSKLCLKKYVATGITIVATDITTVAIGVDDITLTVATIIL